MNKHHTKILNVVLGIVFNQARSVLIAQRNDQASFGNYWEFPGGKIKTSESTLDALKREWYEEVGVNVIAATPILCFQHDYVNLSINFNVWHIKEFSGNPYGREGQKILWVDIAKLHTIKFPDANKTIISWLENQ